MKYLSIIALILALITAATVFVGCNNASVAQPADTHTVTTDATLQITEPSLDGVQSDSGNSSELDIPASLGVRDLEFDESKLLNSAEHPDFNGRAFDIKDKDMGDGSYMNVAKQAGLSEFSDYLSTLVDAGFTYYADNRIGRNYFVTFATKTQIVNVMYLAASREVRVVTDDRATFSLQGLPEENVYEDLGMSSLTVVAIEETGWPGGMGYIMELADGTFFIIDGGYYNGSNISKSSAEWVYKTLRKMADDPENITVAAWLITHPHGDHYGAFVSMAQVAGYRDDITVEKLIYNNPAEEYVTSTGTTAAVSMIESSVELWGIDTLIKAHPGQVLYVKDAVITVYGTADIVVPQDFVIENVNNLNVVTMVDYMGKRSLYLGDSQEVQNPILVKLYGKELKADVLQLAHHGYDNTDAGLLYKYADPSIVFWPVSTSHYEDIVKHVGFNQMFFAPGVTNYVAGYYNMTVTDFDTWIPDERWDPTA